MAGLKFLLNHNQEIKFPGTLVTDAVFRHTDDEFKISRVAINQALKRLQALLNQHKQNEPLENILLLNIYVLLSFYVFMKPEIETLSIPQKKEGNWVLATYTLKLIPLFENKIASVSTSNTIYAYCLTPIDYCQGFSPILLYRGTPPSPDYDGFDVARATDFDADKMSNIGERLFMEGFENIKSWLGEMTDACKAKVIVAGHSLGGSLSLLTALSFPENLERVFAFSPAGFKKSIFTKKPFDAWKTYCGNDSNPIPLVQIFKQQYCPVSSYGAWAIEWELYRLAATRAYYRSAHVILRLEVIP